MQTKLAILSTTLFATLAATCLANPRVVSPEDAQGVERASAQFYTSLNALFTGDAAPMKQVWSHADDVTYMGPAGGFLSGWTRVQAAWETQAAMKLGGEIVADTLHVTVGDDLAIVHCRESGSNRDAQGRPLPVSIRATNVFRKENGVWKMIGHHTDLLPFLQQDSAATE
ncbi:MAG TPA: nuclear transport factor 2 family protein [Pirellulales bacterium]|jgi:ketosteroid isomerase-like protein|nr:nuclear transport factor 2 family protein [Pirellulales bacterium]